MLDKIACIKMRYDAVFVSDYEQKVNYSGIRSGFQYTSVQQSTTELF